MMAAHGAGGPDARCRALAYSLVAVPLLRLPDAELLDQLRSEDFARTLDEIEAAFPAPGMAEGLALVRSWTAGVCAGSLDELARDRTYLLRALAPGVGAPPPYESSWRSSSPSESAMADLADLYRRAGVGVAPEAHERPDYLGVELMFMMRLVAGEAEAAEEGRAEARARQAGFFFGHLDPWAADYARAALPHAATGFFEGLLRVLLALLEEESSHLKAVAA